MSETPFWQRPETVERFAAREPDARLVRLLEDAVEPLRVLDLGCAGGRNTVLLAQRGHDVRALDASTAMVEKTRERLAPFLGRREARERVVTGTMADLGAFADGSFDLVVALGIYHNAADMAEWSRAVAETSRVLGSGGRLLVAVFTPETDLTGEGVRPVPGEPHVYAGFPSGRVVLMDAATLDRKMARYGLVPAEPSAVVEKETESGRRVTVNALYRRIAEESGPSRGADRDE